jgi:hypothetical protein
MLLALHILTNISYRLLTYHPFGSSMRYFSHKYNEDMVWIISFTGFFTLADPLVAAMFHSESCA